MDNSIYFPGEHMRTRQFLHKVLVIFVLLPTLFTLTACKGDEQIKEPSFSGTEFISTTNLFSLTVPVGWSAEEVVPGADLLMANTEAALERYHIGSAIEAGDLVLNVGFLPLALFQEEDLSHLDFQLEASPEVFLESLLPLFRIGDKPADNVAGEATLVSLHDGRDAGVLTFSEQGREGLILVFEAGAGVFAFVSAAGFPGEMNEFQEITYAVADAVAYNGTQDALYDALYGD
jgi:hypothetical protein